MTSADYDVAIIGAGPSGIAAALALAQRGVGRVIVLEREAEAGGIPRHCGHKTFGKDRCYRSRSRRRTLDLCADG